MKITVTQITNIEVEITFPCYVKSKVGFHFYYLPNELTCTELFNGYAGGYSIKQTDIQMAFQDGFQIIKGSEYKIVLNDILKELVK